MIRLVLSALLALLAAEAFVVAQPAAAQESYRRYDAAPDARPGRPRMGEDEAYFNDRLRYYKRDAVARRAAQDRRRASDDDRPRQSFGSFIQRLFGGDSEADRDGGSAIEVRPSQRSVRRRPPPPADPTRRPPPPAIAGVAPGALPAAKVEPSTVAAVFGDSIADGLAGGLDEAFAASPDFAVRRHVKANAGLVRGDYFDFVEDARKAVSAEPITYAVIDVGVNDRQPFLDMRQTPPLSEAWIKRYEQRIDAMIAPFKERKIPIYWVGLAPSESAKATREHIVINATIKERVEAAGGTYVDVWEGFVDEDGAYAQDGPALDGQTGRLRLEDGVHFSKEGARKLAHYVEREIRKVYQPKPAADAVAGAVVPEGDPQPAETGAPAVARPRPIASQVVVLTAPRRAEGGALAAAAAAVPARDASPDAERVLVKGETLDAAPGRLDDYRWPGAGRKPEAPAWTPPPTP